MPLNLTATAAPLVVRGMADQLSQRVPVPAPDLRRECVRHSRHSLQSPGLGIGAQAERGQLSGTSWGSWHNRMRRADRICARRGRQRLPRSIVVATVPAPHGAKESTASYLSSDGAFRRGKKPYSIFASRESSRIIRCIVFLVQGCWRPPDRRSSSSGRRWASTGASLLPPRGFEAVRGWSGVANAKACEVGPRRACSSDADGVFGMDRIAPTGDSAIMTVG